MWHDTFVTGISYGEKTIRTVLVYAAVVVLLRLAGKRELSQLNTLIRDGELQARTLRRLALRPANVIASSRRQGAEHVRDVQEMVPAPGGSMLVKLKEAEEGADQGDVRAIRADLARIQERLDEPLRRGPQG